jgi:hypothetical protein
VVDVAIELWVEVRLEDVLEDPEFRFLFRLEALGVIEDLAVAIAEDVRRPRQSASSSQR